MGKDRAYLKTSHSKKKKKAELSIRNVTLKFKISRFGHKLLYVLTPAKGDVLPLDAIKGLRVLVFRGVGCPGPGDCWGNSAVLPASKEAESPSRITIPYHTPPPYRFWSSSLLVERICVQ